MVPAFTVSSLAALAFAQGAALLLRHRVLPLETAKLFVSFSISRDSDRLWDRLGRAFWPFMQRLLSWIYKQPVTLP